jgi:hypothetical protein
VWDVLASGVKTDRDLLEKALGRLSDAERELGQAEAKRRKSRATDQRRADLEEKDHA